MDIFLVFLVYRIKTASLLITEKIASHLIIAYGIITYKLLPTGFKFERSWELDKIAMQWFEFFVEMLMMIFPTIFLV